MPQQLAHPPARALAPCTDDDREHQTDLQARRDHRGEKDQRGDELMVALPELLRSAGDGGEGLAPGNGQAEHRHGVRQQVEKEGCRGQRECAVQRVLAPAPQLFATARTARRGAGCELG